MKQKQVTILTGFLGAGKTTVLNAILDLKKETRFAIIENEVGEIGIDSDLIIKNTDSFTELNNGCICCSLNDNFVDTLRQLTKREDWDELIIEATGVANPGGIISPFKQLPWLQKYFQLPVIIGIVDVQQIEEQLKISDTAASQLAYSDMIYLGKADLVEQDIQLAIQSLVQRLNPFASLLLGHKNNIPVERLIQQDYAKRPILQIKKPTQPDILAQHDRYDAIAIEFDIAFDENKLYQRLYTFLMAQSEHVYRFKGIFYDSRNAKKLIIQSVMKSLYIDEGEPWNDDTPRKSKFVFIGKNLQKKGFERMLRSCKLSTESK